MKARNIWIVAGVVIALVAAITLALTTILSTPPLVEEAKIHTQQILLPIEGIVVFSENIIPDEYSGRLSFLYPDGTKVKKGEQIAVLYESSGELTRQRALVALTEERDMLLGTKREGATDQASLNIINEQLHTRVSELSSRKNHGNLEGLPELKNSFIELFTLRNVAMGLESDFSERLLEIEGEIAELEAAANTEELASLLSPAAGYFVSSTDGYEGFASIEDILNMNAADIRSLLNEKSRATQESAGKIIEGFDWYFVALVPNDMLAAVQDYAEAQVKLRRKPILKFSFESSVMVSASIYSVKPRLEEDETIVVFLCDTMTPEISTMRKKPADIVLGEYTGIKFSKSCLFFEEGEPGVYVNIGNDVQFRKIDIIYEDENYILSAIHDGTGEEQRTYLQPGDIIMINGKE